MALTVGHKFSPGDRVKCIRLGSYFKHDEIYIVKSVSDGGTVQLESNPDSKHSSSTWFSDDRFVLVRTGMSTTEDLADKIMALYNSRPWSPTRDELITMLKEHSERA